MGAQKNRLIETVLLSTYNMFWFMIEKLILNYTLLSRALYSYHNGLNMSHDI